MKKKEYTEEEQHELLRKFVIKYLKRFQYEFEFLATVVNSNPEAYTDSNILWDNLTDVSGMIEDIIITRFDKDEVEVTPMLANQEHTVILPPEGVTITSMEDVA